jgi:hypothetical protein
MDLNTVETKLKEMGYVHPTTSATVSEYMSYSDSHKDTYLSNQSASVYSTYDASYAETDAQAEKKTCPSICPVCQKKATLKCNCTYAERMCNKGHMWYMVNGEVKIGDPHEINDKTGAKRN